MKLSQNPKLCAIADGLLRWYGTSDIGGEDVLVWIRKSDRPEPELGIAIVGKAKVLQARLFRNNITGEIGEPVRNINCARDVQLQLELGIPAWLEKGSGWHGVKSDIGQTMSEGKVGIDEISQSVRAVVEFVLEYKYRIHFTVMPREGKPWNGRATEYYSAKTKRIIVNKAPPVGFVKRTVQEHSILDIRTVATEKHAIDFCKIAGKIKETESGVVGAIGSDRFMLTRTLNVAKIESVKATIKGIKECGGMLFPSMAISDVPATNFGTLVLVSRLALALRNMKSSVSVYTTDAWTESTADYQNSKATWLYEQLTGGWSPTSYGYMIILGPMSDPVDTTTKLKRITSVSGIGARLKQIRKVWKRSIMTRRDMEDAGEKVHYPYLEVKPNAIVEVPDTFPLAVCEYTDAKRAKQLLRGIGFNGEFVIVDYGAPASNSVDRWSYAWKVRDAILKWQESKDAKHARQQDDWLEVFHGDKTGFNTPRL